jgi:hypothetical protein
MGSAELASILADVRLKYIYNLKDRLQDCKSFCDIPVKWRINVEKEVSGRFFVFLLSLKI